MDEASVSRLVTDLHTSFGKLAKANVRGHLWDACAPQRWFTDGVVLCALSNGSLKDVSLSLAPEDGKYDQLTLRAFYSLSASRSTPLNPDRGKRDGRDGAHPSSGRAVHRP